MFFEIAIMVLALGGTFDIEMVAVSAAPIGFEDEHGFHYGNPPARG